MRPITGSHRTAAAMTALGGVLITTGLIGLGGQGATASSHREAPLIAGEPQYDNTDVYAFRSPNRRKTVTLAANWIPFEEPAGGPNFYPWANDARYSIHVDNDGDAVRDITFRWTFDDHYRSRNTILYNNGPVTSLNDPNLNFYQTYDLERINQRPGGSEGKMLLNNARVAPSYVGDASMPDYENDLFEKARVWTGKPGSSGRAFAGQTEDSFFIDLRVFDLLYGGDFSEVGDDTLAGFNVNSVALQLSRRQLALRKEPRENPIIGTWSTTSKQGANGDYRQVSRLGMPLVNELVIALKDKDKFNASQPSGDAQFLDYVLDPELARLLEAIYGIDTPPPPRNDLVAVFLTGVEGLNQPDGVVPSEQLRLNMSTPVSENPDRLGVIGGDNQGYPNGRRLTDDVIDISLQVVAGELVGPRYENDLGDAVNVNDVTFRDTFPYMQVPASGSDTAPHANSGFTPLTGGDAPTAPTSGPSAVPVAPLSAVALGLLALAAGVAVWTKRPGGVASA